MADDKGDCFEASLVWMVGSGQMFLEDEVLLVHGIATGTGPIEGVPMLHAWIEIDRKYVLDVANGKVILVPIEIYYRAGRVRQSSLVKYNYIQALEAAHRGSTYGPWHPSFIQYAKEEENALKKTGEV